MLNNLSGWHFVVIIAVVLLLFGAPKLPGLAKSLGQSMRIFKREVKNLNETEEPGNSTTAHLTSESGQPSTQAPPASQSHP
jgi:sec-independent protein translocase protein TatA